MKKILFILTAWMIIVPFCLNAQVSTGEEKFPDSVNKTDAGGNKTGYWIEKVGEMTYYGTYLANKKVKDWIGYYPNKLIYKVEYYDNGIKNGVSIQFDRKCKISLIENFRNGLSHGLTTYYSQFNETPLSETEYVAGKKNGLYRQYYDNGKIQEESMYRNDLKDGSSKWNNKNGQRIAVYNYKSGNFDGLQTTFYENDSLQSTNNYTGNKLSGESREYYRNGKVKVSGKYLNGLKEGPWSEYDELGKVKSVIRFKEGIEVSKK
jgi:antitoxin component YwqK of YwqJK toxin-antitoxin module